MSAALRKMVPQIRRLGISARNFSSSVGGEAKKGVEGGANKVPDESYKKSVKRVSFFSMGWLMGIGIGYLTHK
ncbi:hypothetical protein MKX03_028111 [Papaver bracteatum]|nr:hypothetical protein MKX03_028111 [Papaver bracteatum]